MECSLCRRQIPDIELGDTRWWLSPLSFKVIGACLKCQAWVASLGLDRDRLIEARLQQTA